MALPAPAGGGDRGASDRRAWIAAILAVALPVAVLSLRLGDDASFFVFHDAQEQTWAWFQRMAMAWHEGSLALWDAGRHAGHSLAGEMQAGTLYPPSWLWLAAFSDARGIGTGALDAFVVLHAAWASLGMYLALRAFGCRPTAALFGALAYALLGTVAMRAASQPNIYFGQCWLPWAAWFAQRHVAGGRARDALLLGAVLGLQLLAGHAQPAFHTALVAGAILLAGLLARDGTAGQKLARLARAGACAGAAALLVAGPQLLLTLEYLADAYRWVGLDFPIGPDKRVPWRVYGYHFILQPADVAGLVDPWRHGAEDVNSPYLGTLPLLMLGLFVARPWARAHGTAWARHRYWLLAVMAFAVLNALGHYGYLSWMLRVLPLAGEVREPGRAILMFHFAACTIAALGFEAWSARKAAAAPRRGWHWVLAVAVALQLTWMIVVRDGLLSAQAAWQLALAVALLGAGAMFALPAPARIAAAFALLLSNAVAMEWLVLPPVAAPARAEARFAPLSFQPLLEQGWGRYRVLLAGETGLPSNFGSAHRVQTVNGYGATMHRPYFDFISQVDGIDSERYDLLNVRYVVSREPLDLPRVASDAARGVDLYERRDWLPRVFLQSQARAPAAAMADAIGLETLEYGDHAMRFRLRAAAADLAVISEIDYPGWCAQVNGMPVPLVAPTALRPAAPLRAVAVAAGTSEITLRYRPFASRLGWCD